MTQVLASARRRSPFLFDFDPVHCLAAAAQSLDARTGQVSTFTRTSASTALDENGATISVAKGLPKLGYKNGAFGLTLASADALSYAFNCAPQAASLYSKTVENTATAGCTANRIWHVGSGAARLSLYRTNTGLSCDFNNGSATKTATYGVSWSVGDTLEVMVTIDGSGIVTLWVNVNGSGAHGTSSAAQTLPAAWGAATLYVNSDATPGNQGSALYQLIRASVGVQTLATMQATV